MYRIDPGKACGCIIKHGGGRRGVPCFFHFLFSLCLYLSIMRSLTLSILSACFFFLLHRLSLSPPLTGVNSERVIVCVCVCMREGKSWGRSMSGSGVCPPSWLAEQGRRAGVGRGNGGIRGKEGLAVSQLDHLIL